MASPQTSFVVFLALALACVAMVPVAHAGVGVSARGTWDVGVQPAYCNHGQGVYDEYRVQVLVASRPAVRSRRVTASRRYVIQRVQVLSTDGILFRPTVVPAARSVRLDRSCVVSTSRSVRQVRRASFEARQSATGERARDVSAKQQDAPVKVASKSAK
jgi:hypothetical protein